MGEGAEGTNRQAVMTWTGGTAPVDVRDHMGALMGRFYPETRVLELRRGRHVVELDIVRLLGPDGE